MRRHLVRKSLFPLFLLVLLFLVAGTPANAQIAVSGKVAGPEGGAVVGGFAELVPIHHFRLRGQRQLAGHLRPEPVARRKISAAGDFVLNAPAPGLWIVEVRVPGYRAMELWLQPLLAPKVLPRLELEQAREITVTVRDAEGQPAQGASVTIERENRWRNSSWRGILPFAKTDEAGQVRLYPLAGEAVEVTAFSATLGQVNRKEVVGGRLDLAMPSWVLRTFIVKEPGGQPAADVLVVMDNSWAAGLTDEAGRFTVAATPEETLEIELYTEGVEVQGLRLPPPTDNPTVFTLPAPRRLQGRVIDGRDRTSVHPTFVWVRQYGEVATWTQEGGFYTLALPHGADTVTLVAAATGYRVGSGTFDTEAATLPTLVLDPAAELRGRVVDEDGLPLAHVEVEAAPTGPRRRRPVAARTDRDGRFLLGGLHRNRDYELRLLLSGYTTTWVEASTTREDEIRVTLEQGCRGTGWVVGPGGEPVVNAKVTLTPVDKSGTAYYRHRRGDDKWQGLSDPEGRFEVFHLATRRYRMEARAEGFAASPGEQVEAVQTRDGCDLGTISMEAGAELVLEIRDVDDRPVEGAEARLREEAGAQAVTDAEGRLVLRDLKSGHRVNLEVSHPAYVRHSLHQVEVTPDAITVVLQPAARILGKVLKEKGEPPAWGRVLLSGGPDDNRSLRTSLQQDGSFRLGNLAAGTYNLQAEVPGHLSTDTKVLELAVGQEVRDVKLTVREGAVLQGYVLSPEGLPVHHANLFVTPNSENESHIPRSRTRTDGDGHYQLKGIPPGSRQIEISHRDYPRARRTVEIQHGNNKQDFTLDAGVTVTGRAVSTTGEPVFDTRVRMTHTGVRVFREVTTTPDGTFRIPSLTEGTYRLSATSPTWITEERDRTVEVRAGMAELELTMIRGAFLVGQVRAPEPKARIRISASGEQRAGIQIDLEASGNYRLGPLTPGTWTVRAIAQDSREQVQKTVAVEAGDGEIPLDLEIETGLALSGRVLRDGTPLAGAYVYLSTAASDGASVEVFTTASFQGTFRLPSLTAGEYQLWIGARGSGIRHTEVLSLNGDREIAVDIPTFPVEGVVRSGAGGNPVANATVTFHPLAEHPLRIEAQAAATVRTGPDGAFRFPTVTRGRWELRIAGNDHTIFQAPFDLPQDFGPGLEVTLTPSTDSQ